MANKGLKIFLLSMLVVVIIASIIGSVFYFSRQTGFAPSFSSIRQYTQKPDSYHDASWQWMDDYPLSLAFDGTAVIGDYKISISTASKGVKYSDYYCSSNTCGGTSIGIDQYNCPLWKGNIGQVSCDGTIPSNCCLSGCTEYVNGYTDAHTSYCTTRTQNGGQCGGADACYQNSPAIGAGFTYYADCISQCGGQTRDKIYESSNTCWAKADIYYKDKLVTTLDWSDARQSAHISRNEVTTHQEERLHVDLKSGAQYIGGDCRTIVNDYFFIFKPDDFTLNITSPQKQVFEDENVAVFIHIRNNYGEPVSAKLLVKFEVPTTVGTATKTEEKILDLPTGESVHEFNVPTTQVTDKIIITPKVDIIMKGSEFSGVNSFCYGQELTQYPSTVQNLGGCNYVKIGEVQEQAFQINIIPKPLYLSKEKSEECISGYSENPADPTLCIRDDIRQFSCAQLGCPAIEGHDYQCTSSGFCAETVFVLKDCSSDSSCPENSKCELSSGLCIREEIFDNIIQCSSDSDCITPCAGIQKSCAQNRCSYSGECDVRTEKEVIEKIVEVPVERIVEKPIEIEKKVEITKTVSKIPTWIWYVIGAMFLIIVLIIISSIIFKKKRK